MIMDSIWFYIIAILIINIYSFFIMFIDKRNAVKNKYRISERKLLSFAFLFGAIGVAMGMYICRHKTKHLKFKIAVPLALVLNIAEIWVLFYFVFIKK